MKPAQALDRATLETAAHWFVELRCAADDAALQAGLQRWLDDDPRHRLAWERLAHVQGKFAQVTPTLARPMLASAQARRREVVKLLALLLATGGSATLAWNATPLPTLMADQRTATGERRRVQLSDGSQLHLNTATALDIRFDQHLREVRLLDGEIFIETAQDSLSRPFVVHTSEGSVRALGTRFIVRHQAGLSRVSVQQHAVEVRCSQAAQTPVRVEAGQQLSFHRTAVGTLHTASPQADAWLHDMLVVHDWRLGDFIQELQRYRPGHLGCAAAIADMPISGAFHLGDTDRILANLSTTLPVRIRQFSRFWVTVEAA